MPENMYGIAAITEIIIQEINTTINASGRLISFSESSTSESLNPLCSIKLKNSEKNPAPANGRIIENS